jgi:peroxiredoxin
LRSFQAQLNEFTRRGIRVVAISVDPAAASRMLAEKVGLTFTLLSDPEEKVIRPYDLLHIRGGPKGANIARPAEFLINPDGRVKWVNLTADARVRIRGDEFLREADAWLGTRP